MYKYCPLCKGNLKKIKKGFYICQNCNFHFYDNPKPTTAVFIINKQKEILLVQRNRNPKKNYWDSPGGFIEVKETAEESAKREVREELGIKINILHYIGSFTGNYFYQKINYSTLCFAFFTKLNKKKVELTLQEDEIKKAKFFKKENIPWKKIAFVDVRAALKRFLSSLQ